MQGPNSRYILSLYQLNADFGTSASIWKFGHLRDGCELICIETSMNAHF